METKHLTPSVAGLLAVTLAGCLTNEPPSKEWLAAEDSIAREEWLQTNGMAWPSITGPTETVMTPGMRIVAKTSEGEIVIDAGRGYARSYTWDGATRSVELIPRKARWYGGLGIYYPGPGQHWKPNKGITRGVLEEGILWFKDLNGFWAWIREARTQRDYIYSKDGLVVGWRKVLERKQLNVDVWQIMIAGQKPEDLPDNNDTQIEVTPSAR